MSRTASATTARKPFWVDRMAASIRQTPCALMRFACAWMLCWMSSTTLAQEAGTAPPQSVTRPQEQAADLDGVPIRSFMFLDRQLNPVFVPPMTFEQYHDLELRSETQIQRQRYLWRRIRIDGTVNGNSADLSVEIRLKIEATGKETISIPLAMQNFHRRSTPEILEGDVDGNSLAISVDDKAGGYVLLASVTQPTEVAIRMKMLARVDSESTQSLECRLPPAPVSMVLTSDRRGATAEVIGRGDEVTRTEQDESGRSRFVIESGGGPFTLSWDTRDRSASVPFLETNSNVSVQWNAPQEQLVQNVLLTVRNSRGAVSEFELRLPKGGRFYNEQPKLSSGGQYLELSRPDPKDSQLYLVKIPKQERQQRIDLELSIEIPAEGVSESKPFELEVPVVEKALRQEGKIQITTSSDYRLRWNQQPYVQNVTTPPLDEGTVDSRIYEFEFSRGRFKLPLWLVATQRQLDVTSECELEILDRYATLEMRVVPVGSGRRLRLLTVDLAGWDYPQISDASSGAPLPWYRVGEFIEIEMPLLGMEEISPILIRLQRTIGTGDLETAEVEDEGEKEIDRPFRLTIPRVVGSGDRQNPVTVQESIVRTVSKGRRVVVVDLERSTHIERVFAADEREDSMSRQFRVVPTGNSATLVGALTNQKPQIILEKSVSVRLSGDTLEAVINWDIESKYDLQGRLAVKFPQLPTSILESDWSVSVNGTQGAQLRELLPSESPGEVKLDSIPLASADQESVDDLSVGDEVAESRSDDWSTLSFGIKRYDLVSDSLGAGRSSIRFRYRAILPKTSDVGESNSWLLLPLPDIDDVTLRRPVSVDLIGDSSREVFLDGQAYGDHVEFNSLPNQALPIKIAPRASIKSELNVETVLIRSAVSETVQHDQVLATVLGAGDFMFELEDPENTDLKATVDGEPATLSRVDRKFIVSVIETRSEELDATPEEEEAAEPAVSNSSGIASRHVIDIRLWHVNAESSLLPTVKPLAAIGPGSDKLFWQLTVPPNRHLVWARASAGRAMQWVLDSWRFVRQPLYTDAAMTSRIASAEPTPMPMGNRYLFSAMDGSAFQVKTGTRTLLWLFVAGALILATTVLTYVPTTRSPLAFALAIIAFTGILAVAPDAAIIVAQTSMFAIVIVVVMLALRSLVMPTQSRVLTSTQSERREPPGNIASPSDIRPPSSIAATRSFQIEEPSHAEKADSATSEVAS